MPKLYGRGPYGQGNYSAATTYMTAWGLGTFAISGNAIGTTVTIRTPFEAGPFVITGFPVGTGVRLNTPWDVGAIFIAISDVQFQSGNIWAPTTPGSDTWIPQPIPSDPWSPVIPGSTTWTPN